MNMREVLWKIKKKVEEGDKVNKKTMKNYPYQSKSKKQKGFTLIELMVSVALFTVVMLVSVAAILSIIGGNKKAQAINSVVNNLNFAIESMVRDMKTGFLYKCPDSLGGYNGESWPIGQSTLNLCSTPGTFVTTVAFFSTISGVPEPVEYTFVPASASQNYGVIRKKTVVAGVSRVENLTSPEVNVKDVRFYVNSPLPASQLPENLKSQPSIFMVISGDARIGKNEVSRFGLQTFVSQRILNL
jgi:prepilin-type N-terminal cleavage/methylation domain-containing protein